MSIIKPRHAVSFHFFNDEDTRYEVYDRIRETYDGPLSMDDDMMVWNITKDTQNAWLFHTVTLGCAGSRQAITTGSHPQVRVHTIHP